MKKFATLLFAVMLIIPGINAQPQPNNDVPFEILLGEGGSDNGGQTHRSSDDLPIKAVVCPTTSSLLISFRNALGSIGIKLENNNTNEITLLNIDAVPGSQSIYIPYHIGFYEITFTLPDGHIYFGTFMIE